MESEIRENHPKQATKRRPTSLVVVRHPVMLFVVFHLEIYSEIYYLVHLVSALMLVKVVMIHLANVASFFVVRELGRRLVGHA